MTHWWPEDGNANDIVGSAHGMLRSGAGFAPGKVLQGFSFNGSGASVSFGATAGNFGTSDFTIDFWMSTTSTAQMGIVGKRPNCDHGSFWDLRLKPGGFLEAEIDGGTTASYNDFLTTGHVPLNDGQFHLVAVVRQGDTMNVYLDGTLRGSGSTTE